MGTNNTSLTNTLIKAMLLFSCLALTAPVAAQSKKAAGKAPAKVAPAPQSVTMPSTATVPPEKSSGKGDQVDISDIENKYWAPKDTDFNVVQNRTYTKEKRFSISAQYGPVTNETMNEGNSMSLGVNYFFSERLGLQMSYSMLTMKNSSATKAFIDAGGGPDFGRPIGYYDLGINWIPFYAKMSVIGKKIIYFDMGFTPVIGMLDYEAKTKNLGNFDKSSMTYGFDVTQWFFMHNNFAVRLDLKQRWYKEEIVRYYTSSGIAEGVKLRSRTSDNTSLLIGLALFF